MSTNPATNAPIIPSTPATSARKAEKNTVASMKIYCEVFSLSNLLKNQRAIFGIIKNMIREKIPKEVIRRSQKEKSKLPLEELVIMARIIKTAVSVNMVPPTVMATEECLDNPNLLIMG